MPLTDTAIRNAKPGRTPAGKETDKPYKLGDERGLYLEVAPAAGNFRCLMMLFSVMHTRTPLSVSIPSPCFFSGEGGESGDVHRKAAPLLGFSLPTFSETGKKQWGTSPLDGDWGAVLCDSGSRSHLSINGKKLQN